jgi:hypothetical protein
MLQDLQSTTNLDKQSDGGYVGTLGNMTIDKHVPCKPPSGYRYRGGQALMAYGYGPAMKVAFLTLPISILLRLPNEHSSGNVRWVSQ